MRTNPIPVPAPSGNDKADIRALMRYVQNTHGLPVYTPHDLECFTPGAGIVMASPNGTRWRITVSDAGSVSASAA